MRVRGGKNQKRCYSSRTEHYSIDPAAGHGHGPYILNGSGQRGSGLGRVRYSGEEQMGVEVFNGRETREDLTYSDSEIVRRNLIPPPSSDHLGGVDTFGEKDAESNSRGAGKRGRGGTGRVGRLDSPLSAQLQRGVVTREK